MLMGVRRLYMSCMIVELIYGSFGAMDDAAICFLVFIHPHLLVTSHFVPNAVLFYIFRLVKRAIEFLDIILDDLFTDSF